MNYCSCEVRDEGFDLRHWYVVGPEYSYVEPVLDDGSGPSYDTHDVVEVWAATKRRALIVGFQHFSFHRAEWIRDARGDGKNPFKGMEAHLPPEDEPAWPEGRPEARIA